MFIGVAARSAAAFGHAAAAVAPVYWTHGGRLSESTAGIGSPCPGCFVGPARARIGRTAAGWALARCHGSGPAPAMSGSDRVRGGFTTARPAWARPGARGPAEGSRSERCLAGGQAVEGRRRQAARWAPTGPEHTGLVCRRRFPGPGRGFRRSAQRSGDGRLPQ